MFRYIVLVKVAKNGLVISDLMFVDDCLIFCKANRGTARHVKDILEIYSKVQVNCSIFINLQADSQRKRN